MITRKEYEKVISSFLIELQGTVGVLDTIEKLPSETKAEIREGISSFLDPNVNEADAVGFAFGIIDEYVNADWENIIDDCYKFYIDLYKKKS